MKRITKRTFYCMILTISMVFLTNLSFAQPGDPGDDPDVPIDGGVSLLVAAGAGYGIKRYRDSRKEKAKKV